MACLDIHSSMTALSAVADADMIQDVRISAIGLSASAYNSLRNLGLSASVKISNCHAASVGFHALALSSAVSFNGLSSSLAASADNKVLQLSAVCVIEKQEKIDLSARISDSVMLSACCMGSVNVAAKAESIAFDISEVCPIDYVHSCFGAGYWIGDMPWVGDDAWC